MAPVRVGITGNIGSGKSTVCRIFRTLGIPVYDADSDAKRLMVDDQELVADITALLGRDAYLPDGSLDRAWVGSRVFADPDLLSGLNALVHPAVRRDSARCHAAQPSELPYTLHEAALTLETGGDTELDRLIVVTAPQPLRLSRTVARDGSSEEAVLARMAHQWPEEKKTSRADYLIVNDGKQLLVPQVMRIHRALQEVNASS